MGDTKKKKKESIIAVCLSFPEFQAWNSDKNNTEGHGFQAVLA